MKVEYKGELISPRLMQEIIATRPSKRRNRKARQVSPEEKLRYQEAHLQKVYGIGISDYNRMFEAQDGCCAICGKHQSELKQRLFIDHNHYTGEIRELLCCRCNHIVGGLESDVVETGLAMAYIKLYNE